jgi:hypothetical protein
MVPPKCIRHTLFLKSDYNREWSGYPALGSRVKRKKQYSRHGGLPQKTIKVEQLPRFGEQSFATGSNNIARAQSIVVRWIAWNMPTHKMK